MRRFNGRARDRCHRRRIIETRLHQIAVNTCTEEYNTCPFPVQSTRRRSLEYYSIQRQQLASRWIVRQRGLPLRCAMRHLRASLGVASQKTMTDDGRQRAFTVRKSSHTAQNNNNPPRKITDPPHSSSADVYRSVFLFARHPISLLRGNYFIDAKPMDFVPVRRYCGETTTH